MTGLCSFCQQEVAVDDKEDEISTPSEETQLADLKRYELAEACARFAQAESDWVELL